VPTVQPDRDPESFLPQRLNKVQKLTAAARTFTNPFFYNHFLSVDSTPFDANLFEGLTMRLRSHVNSNGTGNIRVKLPQFEEVL
jgi:hypothetical protein